MLAPLPNNFLVPRESDFSYTKTESQFVMSGGTDKPLFSESAEDSLAAAFAKRKAKAEPKVEAPVS